MKSPREQILEADDIQVRELWIPEWKQKVYVYAMSGVDRERFEAQAKAARDRGTVRALMAVLSCRDEHGARIFEDSDVEALAKKSVASLGRVFDAAVSLSAISRDDIEEIEGN